MSTYKVLQDIEAEDHILGPLTLRQFIFGLIAAFFMYICFISVTKGAPLLLILFLPPALFTGFFAIPFGGDQPTELWALAKIRFYMKPRKRIWDQSGAKELVTITVPKKIEVQRTDGLSQMEVRSRLSALGATLDSRGWATKNILANPTAAQTFMPGITVSGDSDRLVPMSSMPQPVPDNDITAADDMLDAQASPLAQQFDGMLTASAEAQRARLIKEMSAARDQAEDELLHPKPAPTAAPTNQQWFAASPLTPAQPTPAAAAAAPAPAIPVADSPVVAQMQAPVFGQAVDPTEEDEALAASIKKRQSQLAQAKSRLYTIGTQPAAEPPKPPQPPVTAAPSPAILELAKNNDLNVATLARQAGKTKEMKADDGEVVVSLH